MSSGLLKNFWRQIIFIIWHISLRLNKQCGKMLENGDSQIASASPKTPPNTSVITPVMLARRPSSLRRVYAASEERGSARKLTPLPKTLSRNLFGDQDATSSPKICLFGLAPHLADEVEHDRMFRMLDDSRDSSRLL